MILPHKLGDPNPIPRNHRLGRERTGREVTCESNFSTRTEARADEVCDLGDDKLRHDERAFVGFEQRQAGFMIAVVFIDKRIQRSGIDNENYRPNSSRRISSIRRAVSV